MLHKKWNSAETIMTRWHQACKVTQDAVNSIITYDAHTQTHTDTHSQSVQPVGMWLRTDVFRTSSGCSFPRIPSVGERAHSASNMVRSIENKLPANKTCLSQSKKRQEAFQVISRWCTITAFSRATGSMAGMSCKCVEFDGQKSARIKLSVHQLACAGGMLELNWYCLCSA